MKRPIIILSFGLNVVLLVAILFALRRPAEKISAQANKEIADAITQLVESVSETNLSPSIPPASFDWSQIESEDFLVYANKLRGIGCPEQTVRDILTAEIEQLFVQRRQDLFRPFQIQFWDLMASGHTDFIDTELQKQLDAMGKEKKALLKEILRGGGPDKTDEPSEYELVLGDLLAPEKAQQLRAISQDLAKLREEIVMNDFADAEKQKAIASLSKDLLAQQERLLSPEELEEFKIRKSPFAQQLAGMIGFDASEDELRSLARLKLDETPADKSKVEEQIKTLLGQNRYGEFTRSTNSSFHDLNRVARRYDLPKETVAQAYDFVRATSQQVDAIQNDKEISDEQREAALERLREQTQSALISRLGVRAAEAYRRNSSDWDNIARP